MQLKQNYLRLPRFAFDYFQCHLPDHWSVIITFLRSCKWELRNELIYIVVTCYLCKCKWTKHISILIICPFRNVLNCLWQCKLARNRQPSTHCRKISVALGENKFTHPELDKPMSKVDKYWMDDLWISYFHKQLLIKKNYLLVL